MRDQLEERVSALENIVIDLIDVLAKGGGFTGSVNTHDTGVLIGSLREIGYKLSSLSELHVNLPVIPMGTVASDVREAVQRLKATQETMIDRKAGIG